MSWGPETLIPPSVTFREILWSVAKRAGMIPEEDGLNRGVAAQITEGINAAMKLAWEFHDWPDACLLIDVPLQAHAQYPGRKFLPKRPGTTKIDTLFGTWQSDPLAASTAETPARPESFAVCQAGYVFGSGAPDTIYAKFRGPAPKFTSVLWSASTAYRLGDLVMDNDSGNCFEAMQEGPFTGTALSDTDHWRVVPVLLCLAEPVKAGASALHLQTEGQYGSGQILEQAMLSLLEHEILQIRNQMGMGRSYRG